VTRTCPTCSRPVPDGAERCANCGARLAADDLATTEPSPQRPPSSHGDDRRFLPGTVLDRRYRIVTPLGRGGMGEVYRADDMKLGQAVALKFLPRALEQDAGRLALLMDEVKLARQVSHPNVCRVWDVGEADGLHFVAMEYIDGEDLGSLLRRIGRLPEERGVQIAREICAGLAAIHDQGVLHRDLKPSNVMLDGRGRVRITDFGLATLAAAAAGDRSRAGTPAYMAPEQLASGTVSVRSDLFALGLLLYEVFTGRYAFESEHVERSRGTDSVLKTPSSHVRSLDPVVERAILRCLETDPALRPASALAVAGALPGGNPVLSALMAGETPSPEMVAASGGAGGLRPLVALGLLVALAVGLAGAITLSERRGSPFGPDDKPYAALRDRADDWARTFGAAHAGDDVADGFSRDVRSARPAGAATANPGVFYWYRRSPASIAYVVEERVFAGASRFALPALDSPGAIAMRFDLQGRLLEFRRFPSVADTGTAAPDWGPFFTAAGLDAPRPAPGSPSAVAPVPTRSNVAWTAESAGGTSRAQGGAYGGRVTFFAVGAPYALESPTPGAVRWSTMLGLVPILLMAFVVYFARRNLIEGRADTRGAVRICATLGVVGLLGWSLLPSPRLLVAGQMLGVSLALGAYYIVLGAFGYLALEPIVRRQHPEWLVSWTRLIDGRWADRLVGRDALLGLLGGAIAADVGQLQGWFAKSAPAGDIQSAATGGLHAVGLLMRGASQGTLLSIVLGLVLALLQRTVRNKVLGWILWVPVVMLFISSGLTVPILLSTLIEALILGLVLHRSGLLGMAMAVTVFNVCGDEYLTTHLGAWYGGVTLAIVLVTAAIAVWASLVAARAPRGAASPGSA